ncbi:unnamed protein product, partial [Symbiodinium pilosum]
KAAEFPRGPTAWLASPECYASGREQIDKLIGFPEVLRLECPSIQLPFLIFRLRARGKQWFSAIISVISVDAIHIQLKDSFETSGVVRDDGAGEADPEILKALALASNTSPEDTGLCRSVTGSAQVRCGGVKGMLLSSVRLEGTGVVELPRNMLKFGPETFSREQLAVLSFSKIRPTSLSLDTVLRLEACECDAAVLLGGYKQIAHSQHVEKTETGSV